jgi:formylglycine-generating enzyme required for sulfatase activity
MEIESSAPFEAYTGDGPHIFVSYAHDDKDNVYSYMSDFRKFGVNIWYDEGIPPAGEWVEEIANAIKRSSLFVVFISPRSVDSRFVKSEVGFALSENKYILSIFLEDTEVPPGLALCLQQFQSINLTERDWLKKACSTMVERLNIVSETVQEVSAEQNVVVDHGRELWELWERVWSAQLERGLSRSKGKNKSHTEGSTPLSPSSNLKDSQNLISEKRRLRKLPEKGKTRHPLALDVSINDTSKNTDSLKDNFYEDTQAGLFSWIPAGQLSIVVPYVDETRIVKVKDGFWCAQKLVTQDFYSSIMGGNPSHCDLDIHDPEILNNMGSLPVNNVSWLDAVSFCKALTIMAKNQGTILQGYEYRLPSEVEWEYACRAGTTTKYFFGDNPRELHEYAWFKGNSAKTIHPVGLKKPNPWKLYDMYGNVREWVSTSFQNALLNDSEQDEFRISRGGGYMKSASECQSSSRSTNSLTVRYRNLGFRIVLAPCATS